MPMLGTVASCSMCRTPVELRRLPSGEHHWLARGNRADGSRQCNGGTTPGGDGVVLLTLHKPWDLAWWYDLEGVAQRP